MLLTKWLLDSKGIKKPNSVLKTLESMNICTVESLLEKWRERNGRPFYIPGTGVKTDEIIDKWMLELDSSENPYGMGALRLAIQKELLSKRTGKKIDNSYQIFRWLSDIGIFTLNDLVKDEMYEYRTFGPFTSEVIGGVKLNAMIKMGLV